MAFTILYSRVQGSPIPGSQPTARLPSLQNWVMEVVGSECMHTQLYLWKWHTLPLLSFHQAGKVGDGCHSPFAFYYEYLLVNGKNWDLLGKSGGILLAVSILQTLRMCRIISSYQQYKSSPIVKKNANNFCSKKKFLYHSFNYHVTFVVEKRNNYFISSLEDVCPIEEFFVYLSFRLL